MNTNERKPFRKWMQKKYGIQDANDYTATFTENIAIAYTEHMQARIKELEELLSKSLPVIRNVDTLSREESEAKQRLISKIESLLQSSKQL